MPDLTKELIRRVETSDNEQKATDHTAVFRRIKPGDAESLEIELAVLLKDPELVRQPEFESMLEEVCAEFIPRLDLQDKQLTCTLPPCVAKLLCTADSYCLSGNQFAGIAEESIAAELLYATTSLSTIKELDWSGRKHGSLVTELLSGSTVLQHMVPHMPQLERVIVQENRVCLPVTVSSSLDLSGLGVKEEGSIVISWLLSNCWASVVELDLSDNNLGKSAKYIGDALASKSALSVANLVRNDIPREQVDQLIRITQAEDTRLRSLCGIQPDAKHADFSERELCMLDALMFAADVKSNGSLLSLNIKATGVGEDSKVVIAQAIAQSNVRYLVCDEWALTEETSQALDIRGAKLTPADALLLQNIVCNNGALASLHVGTACIPAAQMARIIAAMRAKESADVLLCGVSMKETMLTELDVSGKMLGTEGALVVVDYMQANQGLRTLNLSHNHMATAEAGRALGDMIKLNSTLEKLDVSNNLWVSETRLTSCSIHHPFHPHTSYVLCTLALSSAAL
jgi:hypothetical protein